MWVSSSSSGHRHQGLVDRRVDGHMSSCEDQWVESLLYSINTRLGAQALVTSVLCFVTIQFLNHILSTSDLLLPIDLSTTIFVDYMI